MVVYCYFRFRPGSMMSVQDKQYGITPDTVEQSCSNRSWTDERSFY